MRRAVGENRRIALCSVKRTKKNNAPPLGLLFLARQLADAGFDVRVFDLLESQVDEAARDIATFGPRWAGFTVFAGPGLAGLLALSDRLRREGISIVWGGPMPTVAPALCLDDQPVDWLVRGEAEDVIVPLAEALCLGHAPPSGGVVGARDGSLGTILRLSPERTRDLAPAWELVDLAEFVNEYERGVRTIQFTLSRGCDSACGFCSACRVNPRWRPYRDDLVRAQLHHMRDRIEFDALFFQDDNLLGEAQSRRRLLEDLATSWYGQMRVDKLDAETVAWLKATGCRGVKIGAESGSKRMLELIRKRFAPADVVAAVGRLAAAGLPTILTFIVGLPHEEEEDRRQTLALIDEITSYGDGVMAELCHYLPYPGTPLYQTACDLGFAPPTRLEGWDRLELAAPSVPWVDRDGLAAVVAAYNERCFHSRVRRLAQPDA